MKALIKTWWFWTILVMVFILVYTFTAAANKAASDKKA